MGFWDDVILCVDVALFHDFDCLIDWWHLSSEEALNYFVNKFQDRALLFPCRANYDCWRTIYGGFSFIFIMEKLSLHGTWQYFFLFRLTMVWWHPPWK